MQILEKLKKKTLYPIVKNPELGDSLSFFSSNQDKTGKVLKRISHYCKVNTIFEIKNNLLNVFSFKDNLLYELVSCVISKFHCGTWNPSYYGEIDRHLKVRSAEHINIFPLTFNKMKPLDESSIPDHFSFCNHSPSVDDFIIFSQKTHVFIRNQITLIN